MESMKKIVLSIVVNSALVVLAVVGAVGSIQNHGSVLESMVYYTQDSNLFLGITSLLYVIALARILRKKATQIPFWIRRLRYFSICCISVTLFVVLLILAPMAKPLGGLKWILFTDAMLYQHLLSPVIAIAAFLLLEKSPELRFKETFYALIPTLIYAAVIYPLNIAGIVDGPYPFLQVGNMSLGMSVLWFFIVLFLSYALAFLMWLCNRKIPDLTERRQVR